MTVFRRFIQTGDPTCLLELAEAFEEVYTEGGTGRIEVSDSIIIVDRLLSILSGGTDPESERCIIISINRLTSFSSNQMDAVVVLDHLQSHPFCNDLLNYAARAIAAPGSTDDINFLHCCFQFVGDFTYKIGSRQEMLYSNDKLIKAIMPHCSQSLPMLPFYAKRCLLSILGSLLNLNMSELGRVPVGNWNAEKQAEYLSKFLQYGGQRAVMSLVADALVAPGASLEQDRMSWEMASNVLANMLKMFPLDDVTLVPEPQFLLDETMLLTKVTPALHHRLLQGPHPLGYVIFCITSISLHFAARLHYPGQIIERFLFYKSGSSDTAKSLLRLFYDAAVACNDTYYEGSALRVIDCMKGRVESLAARIDADVPIIRKDDKDRHCAYPHCLVVGEGLVGSRMMKCGRCLAVYYCSKEHQTAHWREHKRTCTPAAT